MRLCDGIGKSLVLRLSEGQFSDHIETKLINPAMPTAKVLIAGTHNFFRAKNAHFELCWLSNIRELTGLLMFSERLMHHSYGMKKGLFMLVGLLLIMGNASVYAQSGDALKTNRHFKIKKPARLTAPEAMSVYDNVSEQMFRGYAISKEPTAMSYGSWRRYNSAPYTSATHGNRYVNNYANAKAKRYGKMKPGEKLPVGAVIAKDSLTVTNDRSVFAGALFLMEKLPRGKSPNTGDWRYQMIMPDGSLFGDTQGTGAKEVAFCHDCHAAEADRDFLFFIPKKYRRQFLD